jgi:signal transduction histidine kinase
MSALSLTVWSLPELFVGCLCWAIWFVGLSLKSHDPNTNMVMRSYRLVTLAVNLLLTSFFLAHSGLTSAHTTLWWTYLIATTLPPVGMRFSRKASGQPVVGFEVAYWLISAGCAVGLLVAPDAFVGQNRMNPLGYPQANSMMLGLVLTVVQVVTVTWSVGDRFRKNSLGPIGGLRWLTVAWSVYNISALLEQISTSGWLVLPPVFWIGALALNAEFARLIYAYQGALVLALETSNHELQTLSLTLEERVEERSRELESSRLQLIAAERLGSLGQLTAGLAHEVNTPLAAAMTSFKQANVLALEYHDSIGHAQVTEADLREIALELGQSMQIGLGSLERMGEIIRHMRNQTRAQNEGKTRLDLSRLLADSLELLQHAAAKARVELRFETPGVTWWHGEPGRMTQVLTNLVMNAIHACEDAHEHHAERGLRVLVRLSDQIGELWLEIIDDGDGIPQAVRDRIFEPLFSTKDAARGTGLGLAIVRDIVTSQFLGALEFETQTGSGTTFRVRLRKPILNLAPSLHLPELQVSEVAGV